MIIIKFCLEIKEHRNISDYTPLSLAASGGYVNIIKLLLIYGADVEAQSERNKDTALSAAAQAGKYDCCEILLTKGQANKVGFLFGLVKLIMLSIFN